MRPQARQSEGGTTSSPGLGATLSLPGLNINWPFSQQKLYSTMQLEWLNMRPPCLRAGQRCLHQRAAPHPAARLSAMSEELANSHTDLLQRVRATAQPPYG